MHRIKTANYCFVHRINNFQYGIETNAEVVMMRELAYEEKCSFKQFESSTFLILPL